jgi:dienelactone hydrolase
MNTAARTALVLLSAFAASLLAADPEVLPGTASLTMKGDLSKRMHETADREMDRRIAAAPDQRAQFWKRDLSSPVALEKSTTENRERFRNTIGVIDERVPTHLETFGHGSFGHEEEPAMIGGTPRIKIRQVRWPVLESVTAEGLHLEPVGSARGYVIAVPDASQTPEDLAGLNNDPGSTRSCLPFARRLAEDGFHVLVPMTVSRGATAAGNPSIVMTNQPNREWLHRQAYMMGRTLVGYEVQKVLAAVDWISKRDTPAASHIGVAGWGEGGLIALYAAAVDTRISAALVSGYFKPREQTWQEPIYRNMWGMLREFGDAEIASLIAPRALVVEYAREPELDGPPGVEQKQKRCAAPGRLWTPPFQEVQAEWERLEQIAPAGMMQRDLIRRTLEQAAGGDEAVRRFAGYLAPGAKLDTAQTSIAEPIDRPNAAARELRQVREIERHVQQLVQISDRTRDAFFLHKAAPELAAKKWTYAHFEPKPFEPFAAGARPFREIFWREVIGKIDEPLPPPNPRTRKAYDRPKWIGYDVVLETGGETFAWGVLLLPRDLQPNEKRPVVVCQHGRRGMPSDVIETRKEAYHDFAARLVERGFIVLAPHNLYGQEPLYRQISRKGNTVKLSMFSMILRHHQQWLAWLATLPNVDPQRIGFYGLSYGGETAVRVPPLLDGYALSICSGDFNDWTRKVASTDDPHSFMFTDEWEMPYFNMGNTFSYAELTYLMFPRPFMAERGHHDGVAPDRWVASEFAKTRFLYAQYGMADRAEIEFFNGGHTINAQGTFEFLHRHLKWPKRE